MSLQADLVSTVLQLRPVSAATLPRSHGHFAFHGALDLFTHLDPRLSFALHDKDGRKPFTVSPLRGVTIRPESREFSLSPEQTYGWRLTGLSADVAEILLGVGNGTNAPRGVRFHQAVFTLESASVERKTSFSELREQWLPRREAVTAVLRFLSPTTFRLGAHEQPFPLPHWVFGSLLDSWNAHAPAPLEGLDLMGIGLTRWEGKTHRVELGSKLGGTVGFTGEFRYQAFPQNSALHGMVGLLAAYAEFAGVGWMTTHGLGQISPELAVP